MKRGLLAPRVKRDDCYVYAHLDAYGRIFYIGKGVDGRAWSSSSRLDSWKLVASHGYSVCLISSGMPDDYALELERHLIFELRDSGIDLVNVHAGGQGSTGYIAPPEVKEKQRAAKIGKKQSEEHASKSRSARLGKTNSQRHRDATGSSKSLRVIDSDGVIYKSCMQASRDLSLLLDRRCYQGLISMCARGERNNAYGRSWSYEIDSVPEFKPTVYAERQVYNCLGIHFKSVQAAKDWIISMRGSANNQCISASARSNGTLKAYGYQWSYIE